MSWDFITRWPWACTENVQRNGADEPCNRPAVAVRLDGTDSDSPYPVCIKHTRQPMASLDRILNQTGGSAR